MIDLLVLRNEADPDKKDSGQDQGGGPKSPDTMGLGKEKPKER